MKFGIPAAFGGSYRGVVTARLGAALVQALVLFLLLEAALRPLSWPATAPAVYVPLLLIGNFVPMIVILGTGQITPRPLAIWAMLASAALAILGAHEATRLAPIAGPRLVIWAAGPLAPRFSFWLAVTAAVFIAHVLVIDAVIERRLRPSYRRHFDTAWKLGLQLVLAAIFVAVFWAILWLGAELFALVDIQGFKRLLRHDWFFVPATVLAQALALHVTDVNPALIRGARGIVLALFSWLLPLLAVILAAFLASLLFISLKPLWATRFASSLLLTAALTLIFLINCCYQDGDTLAATGRIKRAAAILGMVDLVPIVALVAVALSLRVAQYGWSAQRIVAATIALVCGCYAIGYATAPLGRGRFLARLEITNFATAIVIAAAVLALYTDIADPARLMVADQMARLQSGVVTADTFDFAALRRDGGRWGEAALQTLAGSQDAHLSHLAAAAKRSLGTPIYAAGQPVSNDRIRQSVAIFPAGRVIPPGLLAERDGPAEALLQPCLFQACVGHFAVLKPGEPESFIVVGQHFGFVFQQANGHWRRVFDLAGGFACPHVADAIKSGMFDLAPHNRSDVMIAGHAFSVIAAPGDCAIAP